MHEADEPDAVGDLFDADQLPGKHGAEVDLAAFVTEPTAVGDLGGEVMKRILEILEAPVGPRGFFVFFRRHFHVQGLVWPFLVVVVDELVEASLLDEEVPGRRLGGFLLEGQMHTFVAAVLLGMTGLDALDVDAEA